MDEQANSSRERALERLRALADTEVPESAHPEADQILLDLIDDAEVTEAWRAIPKWWA